MKKVIIFVAVGFLIGFGWWLGAPLFYDREIKEEFPTLTPTPTPIISETKAKPNTNPEEVNAGPAEKSETQPVILAVGEFRDSDSYHKGSGTARVYQLPDGSRLLRLENFSVTNGPDLFVYASEHPAPATSAEVHQGKALKISALKGNLGAQNYDLPPDFDLEKTKSVVIYCRAFGVVFSTATLSSPKTADQNPQPSLSSINSALEEQIK